MEENGVKRIKSAYQAAKKKLSSIRAKRSVILKRDAAEVDSSRLEQIRRNIGKL